MLIYLKSPQEDARNLRTKIGASNIPFTLAWRVTRDESRAKALIIHFMDMGAIGTAVYIINYFPTKALAEMTLEEAFTGHNP